MKPIVQHAQGLVYSLLCLMPSVYQKANLNARLGLFLETQGYPLPEHTPFSIRDLLPLDCVVPMTQINPSLGRNRCSIWILYHPQTSA